MKTGCSSAIFIPLSCWMLLLLGAPSNNTVVVVSSFSAPSPSRHYGASIRMQDMEHPSSNSMIPLKTMLSKSHQQQKTEETEKDQKKSWSPSTILTTSSGGMILATLTMMMMMPDPVLAAGGGLPDGYLLQSSIVSYAHIFSILGIAGCLVAERLLIQTDMTSDDEVLVNRIDLVYGLLAALLIGSGFARSIEYGKGGDYYIHEVMFWIKMTMGGIWGGLSVFPTLIFRQRRELLDEKEAKGNETKWTPPSQPLVNRLHRIVNAEISAIWTIPLLASLMSHGAGYYSPHFWWEGGALVSTVATVGSFWYYGKQALTWSDEDHQQETTMEVLGEEEKDSTNNSRLAMGKN